MIRRAFLAVVIFCLLAELAIGTMWVRSYWVKDEIAIRRDMVIPGTWHSFFNQFYVARGVFEGELETGTSYPLTYIETEHFSDPGGQLLFNYAPTNWVERVGLRYVSYRQYGGFAFRFTVFDFPLWLPMLFFALPPIWWLKPRKKPEPGHCARCGYDLRASPERCPECGTPVV